MKIRLAFLCPHNNFGIGWWDRKYGIYYKNLDPELFEGYMIFITKNSEDVNKNISEPILTEDMLLAFCEEKNIDYIYFGGAKITKTTEDILLEKRVWLVNVNFTPIYTTDSRKLNLIISMTDYWKLYWMHGKLSNSYVVYNPIDVDLWTEKAIKTEGIYRQYFQEKKFIVGRIARAEPSKWHYLILATLTKLDKAKNYDFWFLFAGMPWIYRKYIQLCLSKEMQSCIHITGEQRSYDDIARFYKSVDLFWQTSWIGESFGNVIVEAACFWIPTLTDVKRFYDDKEVRPSLYDAQAEVVDHGITGSYGSFPDACIRFLTSLDRQQLSTLGSHALKKAKSIYHIKDTISNLAKILYCNGKNRWIYRKSMLFESLIQNPWEDEVRNFGDEYRKRIALSRKIDTISQFNFYSFFVQERLWRSWEYLYLFFRKLLKKWVNIDIEKM